MSGALVEPQAILSSVGVGNATEAGGTPFSDVRGGGDGLVQRAEEHQRSKSIALGKGRTPAPNGMTTTPPPVRRMEPVPPTSEPSAPPMAPPPEPRASVTGQGGGEAAQSTSTVDKPVVTTGADKAVVPMLAPEGASNTAVQVPAESSQATGVEEPGKPPAAKQALDMGSMREVLAQAAGTNTAASDAEEQASTNSLKDDPGTPEECNLFVGDLARNLTEEKLEKAFNQHGRVMSVSIKRDRATGKNLGYGFVKMSSHQEARIAKDAMQGVELGGRRVRVGWAQKNTSLFVTGLDPTITTEMLVREFSRFGPVDKELTTIKPNSKGGFVKYRYRLHAETAKKELNGRPAFSGLCQSLHIEWNSVDSSSKSETSGATATGDISGDVLNVPSRSVSLDGDPSSASASGSYRSSRPESSTNVVYVQFEGEQGDVSGVNEAMIRKVFARWEPLVDVVIANSRVNGVSSGPRQLPRCRAFVHFPHNPDGERAAKDAIQALNGSFISGMKVHCTMSHGSMRKPKDDRTKRRATTGGEHGGMIHPMRFGRTSLDPSGPPMGRGGAWSVNPALRQHNIPMAHPRHPLAPSQQHPQPHMQHPHPQHHMHPHQTPHHVQQHQQHQQHQHVYGYPPTTAGSSPAAAAAAAAYAGQYPIAHPGADGAGAAAGGTGEMMVQMPYGMAPYSYMFHGVPYAPAQQGYQMGYQHMYPGYPYQPGIPMDPAMMQGQIPGGVQQSNAPTAPMQQPGQGQGQGATSAPIPQQQQQPNAQHMGTQRPPGQLQAQQQQQHVQQQAAHARVAAHQRQMGMPPAMLMSGGNPAAAAAVAAGLNVGVPAYMHVYQPPQMAPTAGAPVAPEPPAEQGANGAGGVMDGKHVE